MSMSMNENAYPVKNLTLCGRPLSAVTLVTAGDVPTGLGNALDRFVDLVRRATGVTLPRRTGTPDGASIVVGIGLPGEPALETTGREGYVLRTDERCLYITANSERGVIYGLYAALEQFFGWHFLSSDYEVVRPSDGTDIPAGTCRTDKPYFFSRDTLWWDTQRSGPLSNALRLNGNFARDVADYGGGINYGGRFVHSICALAEVSDEVGNQPCLTDEKTFETVRKNVRRILKENPGVDIISVSQNDSYAHQGGCQCENCRAIDEREGTPMGSLLTFVNRIADDIREDYPDVLVDTLAYRYTRKAPKTIKPAPNVLIRLCSIECCFSHPIADPQDERNAAFCRDIEAWSAICDKLYIWDYTTNYLYFIAPFPNLGVLWDNVRFFKAHHVLGMFEQGNQQSFSGELGELRAYLIAHLLWDPDMPKERYYELMDGFLRDYYGPGWTYVREYIDRTTARAAERHLGIYDDACVTVPARDGNDPIHKELLALWDKAAAAASNDAERAHCEKSRLAPLFQYLSISYDRNGGVTDETEAQAAALDAGIRRFDLTHLREGSRLKPAFDHKANPKTWC